MIARAARSERSGISLTEILIAIMIMGVGLISLATLFPLGLLRMREATRYGRTALLYESAADEIDARSLLQKSSFISTWYGPRDPFVFDALADGSVTTTTLNARSAGLSSGLPIVYDPLWRALTFVAPVNANANNALANSSLDFDKTYVKGFDEARFGAAVFSVKNTDTLFNIRSDPDGKTPAAYGLQRLTNFIPYSTKLYTKFYNFTHQNYLDYTAGLLPRPDGAADIFTSVDDIVFNPVSGRANALSPLLPEQPSGSTAPSYAVDYRFSWFFTGRQVDVTNGTQFVGNIVVTDSRPFAFDSVTINGQTATVPAGETTVEAIFGFGTNFGGTSAAAAFAKGANRKVLLRWKVGFPDPQVRVGGWIADVTYDRNLTNFNTRSKTAGTPLARCHWYQVIQKTEAETETANSAGPNDTADGQYRRMVLTLNTDVLSKTLLYTDAKNLAKPVNLNFALVMPSVINVFPRAFEVHEAQ